MRHIYIIMFSLISLPLDCHCCAFHPSPRCHHSADPGQPATAAPTRGWPSGEWCPLLRHGQTGAGNPSPLQKRSRLNGKVTPLPLGTRSWKRYTTPHHTTPHHTTPQTHTRTHTDIRAVYINIFKADFENKKVDGDNWNGGNGGSRGEE